MVHIRFLSWHGMFGCHLWTEGTVLSAVLRETPHEPSNVAIFSSEEEECTVKIVSVFHTLIEPRSFRILPEISEHF